jgi:hypothetical protein
MLTFQVPSDSVKMERKYSVEKGLRRELAAALRNAG